MRITVKEVVKYSECFVCGDCNSNGLQAEFFEMDDGSVVSEITAGGEFQGYKNVLHGGILSAMLDEVMIKAVLAKGIFAVTAEMTVKFKRPVLTGQKIKFTGSITQAGRRIIRTVGEAVNDRGEVVASAVGTYIEAKGELLDTLRSSL